MIKHCQWCDGSFNTESKNQIYCSPKCRAQFRWDNTALEDRIKDKKRYQKDGYVYLYMPDHPMSSGKGWVAEHRFVMSEVLGKTLKSGEFVHHVNGDRGDNRPENLVVMGMSDHNSHHKSLEAKERNRSEQGKFTS
jgi:hypothetical protein